MHNLPSTVKNAIVDLRARSADPISAFVYDLEGLQTHIKQVMAALPENVELFYAIKANSDTEILNTLAPWVNGFEISSGGEIERIARCQQRLPFIFSGPGKLDSELEAAIHQKVAAIHVESISEIHRLQAIAKKLNHTQAVFLRINPTLPDTLSSRLTMAGRATPFGIDEMDLQEAVNAVDDSPNLLLEGFHVHAMSHQKSLTKHQMLIDFYLERWPHWKALSNKPDNITHMNVGGGIGVNYRQETQFDWSAFCHYLDCVLKRTPDSPILRFEPGRFISAFCGYYAMEVLDKKTSHGESFVICRGGTHQFRLPVAQSHDHPVIHLPLHNNISEDHKPEDKRRWTLVGQLCTPKDILSRTCELSLCEVGDILVLPLAGAYGYNISHAAFLCHPTPLMTYLPIQTPIEHGSTTRVKQTFNEETSCVAS
ncbi:L-glutamyl-[BtrI acyl-carrier protein] decarboxylase [Marinomonas spartinae]|uniref:L-glutamyl-[BtrI acyl-carrier protein] decarboxylase n=1 Tax=Marinomonas spartinae TaxID=1792290 RepID=A0A1A8TFC2_9GAMM|nr:type III PLP-dependent enzyme [Marinomonas spartinae]SBS32032.1 L-glutamyl-[BtrI acyl-carrier protein] decarboxylase [Marinomonas spartinae]SBS35608.1 L-glutamyl-[BtrI acyl-carrier protein] decarboxylase [Marinomonas spartinae]